ncbi:hypothetical protein HP499_09040 [Paenarthrobacter sp. CM16]|uniref:hypothetical protein n=1 Tax=Paenarthrobacter sp. CM16 TaxID=2738447 RepID=UPI0015558FF6|nr:hypothetical protein [Paenarthrobacter sp. CM16]NQD87948.1 hypothetical protein [Paenarthrobacter sp. CM16]
MTEPVTWKAMSPAEVCDLMDFRAAADCNPKSLSAMFQTPQGVEIDRKLGD